MDEMIAAGMLGKKSGKGFFIHEKKKKGKKTVNPEAEALIKANLKPGFSIKSSESSSSPSSSSPSTTSSSPLSGLSSMELLQHRMASRFVNEAAYCLQDGVVENPTDGDIGAVFGIGFPPFRGGPFRYLDEFGVAKYVDMMDALSTAYGPQFEPAQILRDYAKEGKKFHPES